MLESFSMALQMEGLRSGITLASWAARVVNTCFKEKACYKFPFLFESSRNGTGDSGLAGAGHATGPENAFAILISTPMFDLFEDFLSRSP
jgi:hypothetical protein